MARRAVDRAMEGSAIMPWRWRGPLPRPSPLLLEVAAILTGLFGCEPRNQYAPPPPPAVTVAHPVERPVTDYVELTGTTQATARVELRSRVNGHLRSIHFEDGANVRKDD